MMSSLVPLGYPIDPPRAVGSRGVVALAKNSENPHGRDPPICKEFGFKSENLPSRKQTEQKGLTVLVKVRRSAVEAGKPGRHE